jgi:hypothetical protein
MSFADRLVLWLHIGFAVFTVGPVALAISSAPRYIRKRDVAILRYLTRITTIFTVGSLAVLIFGIVAGQLLHELSKPWLTASMTLFVVALVLLVLIIRDQRKAVRALDLAASAAAVSAAGLAAQPGDGTGPAEFPGDAAAAPASGQGAATATLAGPPPHAASVERGRIAAMGGVVNLIWLVVLALMVWRP